MNALDTVRFAAQALVGHRLRTGLSVAGVAIGISAVVALTATAVFAALILIIERAATW